MDQTFFGWVLPTLKTSEFAVLQIVGLDAAVVSNYFNTRIIPPHGRYYALLTAPLQFCVNGRL